MRLEVEDDEKEEAIISGPTSFNVNEGRVAFAFAFAALRPLSLSHVTEMDLINVSEVGSLLSKRGRITDTGTVRDGTRYVCVCVCARAVPPHHVVAVLVGLCYIGTVFSYLRFGPCRIISMYKSNTVLCSSMACSYVSTPPVANTRMRLRQKSDHQFDCELFIYKKHHLFFISWCCKLGFYSSLRPERPRRWVKDQALYSLEGIDMI